MEARLPDQIHISLEDRWGIEARVRAGLGCSLHDLLRTLLRMQQAGEIVVTAEDVRRHQGGSARKDS
jgi:hypothetical protein